MSTFLEKDKSKNGFSSYLSEIGMISKTLAVISWCYMAINPFKRDCEVVGEAASALSKLLIWCGQISIELQSNEIASMALSGKMKKSLTYMMEHILEIDGRGRDIVDYLLKYLGICLQEDVDVLISANKMCSFIRFLLETNNFLESKLPSGVSLTWNIKDRLSCQSFIEDVLMKLIEKEIELFSQINSNHKATWLETMLAIAISSSEEVRLASVYLAKKRVVKRLRDLLRLVSLCLRTDTSSVALTQAVDSSLLQLFTASSNSTTIGGTVDMGASLTSEDFSTLLKELSQTKELSRTKNFFTSKSSKTDYVNQILNIDVSFRTIHFFRLCFTGDQQTNPCPSVPAPVPY